MNFENKRLTILEIVVAVVVIVAIILVYLYYSPSLNRNRVSPEVQQAYGLFNDNDLEGAIKTAEIALKEDNTNVPALLTIAAVLAQRGSVEFSESDYGKQSIETAQKVLDLDPENAEAYRIIGYANEIMQEYSKAISAYNKAIELDPKNALALSNRGHAYDLMGDLEKAKEGYQAALVVDSNLDHALLNMGRIYIREPDFNKATEVLKSIMDESENARFRAEAAQSIGTVHLYTGEFALAKEYFENALVDDNTLAVAWVGLAASKYFLLEEDPSNEDIFSVFADLEIATKINPNQTTAYMMTATVLKTMGDTQSATGILEKAKEVVDMDITLGVKEKEILRAEINNDLQELALNK